MKIAKSFTIVGFLLVLGMFTLPLAAKQPGVLLQEGLYAEEIDGNLDKAIEIYQQVSEDKSASDSQAPTSSRRSPRRRRRISHSPRRVRRRSQRRRRPSTRC